MGKDFRSLEGEAQELFARCTELQSLVISHVMVLEVKKVTGLTLADIKETLESFACSVEYIDALPETQLVEAFIKKGIHRSDAMHAALAVKSKCTTFVTFNIKDFRPLQALMRVCEPHELFLASLDT